MAPELYEKVFVFNEAIRNATDTLTSFASDGHCQLNDLVKFADSIRAVRSRANVHVIEVMLREEKSAALDLMNGSDSTPHIC